VCIASLFRLLGFPRAGLLNRLDNRIGFKTQFQGLDQVTITIGIDNRLYFRFEHVIHGQAQFDAAERPSIGWIAASHGFELYARRVDVGRAKQHDEIFRSVFLCELFDSTLNLKVHRAGRGSNKALSGRVNYLSAQICDRLFDRMSGYPVAFPENCDFLAAKLHESFLSI